MSRKAFILIGAFWLALVGMLVGFKEYTRITGQEVLLRTVPVDPRDLFRGDYVILRYEISSLDLAQVELDFDSSRLSELWRQRHVFVSLEVEDGYASATGVFTGKPDGLFIKGGVVPAGRLAQEGQSELALEYGIESFFVPEGAGKAIEQQRRDGMDVRVSIDRFGNAVIRSLVLDGREVSVDDL
jgi:uncharacterized membrane-anchored protein